MTDTERATQFVGVEVLMPAESRADLEARLVGAFASVRDDERRRIANHLRSIAAEYPIPGRLALRFQADEIEACEHGAVS